MRKIEPFALRKLLARLEYFNVNQFFAKPKRMTQADQIDEVNWEGRFARIEQEAAEILKAEGPNHVNRVYFVLESDATMARMVEAERRIAKRDESMDKYIATPRAGAAS